MSYIFLVVIFNCILTSLDNTITIVSCVMNGSKGIRSSHLVFTGREVQHVLVKKFVNIFFLLCDNLNILLPYSGVSLLGLKSKFTFPQCFLSFPWFQLFQSLGLMRIIFLSVPMQNTSSMISSIWSRTLVLSSISLMLLFFPSFITS